MRCRVRYLAFSCLWLYSMTTIFFCSSFSPANSSLINSSAALLVFFSLGSTLVSAARRSAGVPPSATAAVAPPRTRMKLRRSTVGSKPSSHSGQTGVRFSDMASPCGANDVAAGAVVIVGSLNLHHDLQHHPARQV